MTSLSLLCGSLPGDEVLLSDPEGTFDAVSKLTPATDVLLIAAGSGQYPLAMQ